MNIIRAEHLGMCFGVRDAIALAIREADAAPLTILGDLVHNETVLAGLRARGVGIKQDVGAVATEKVMITAHGTSDKVLNQVKQRGLQVLEATCPLVRFAHGSLAELVDAGFHPIVIGKREHVEVRGLTGDLHEFDTVLTEADVLALLERARFGVVAQTTHPIAHARKLVEVLRWRFPASEVRFIDTVCRPTKQRQQAAVELAKQCDVVIVIGGAHSNNTAELTRTCGKYCRRVHHVQNADCLRAEWFAGVETVGITAGTSTPDEVIAEVEATLKDLTPQSGNQTG